MVFPSVKFFWGFLHLFCIGVNPRFFLNGGRGDEKGGKETVGCFFKSEEKLVHAKVSFPTICWCSKRYFLCTCFSPLLSLALLQCHNHQKETPHPNSWLRGGKLRLWISAQPDLFSHPLKVSWPSGCSAALHPGATMSRNCNVEVKGLWKPLYCFVLI